MAKMLIEIPDKTYNYFRREWEKSSFDSPLNNLVNGLFDGTLIPDNATNGDIIKALFPSAVYNENQYLTVTMDCQVRDTMHFVSQFDLDWWNAPYKEHKDGTNK